MYKNGDMILFIPKNGKGVTGGKILNKMHIFTDVTTYIIETEILNNNGLGFIKKRLTIKESDILKFEGGKHETIRDK